MKKVLIVSYHFPPLNSIGSKRYGLMCQYMEEYGYTPYVLTTQGRVGGFNDAGLDLPVPIPEEQILRIGLLGIRYPISNPIKTAAVEWLEKRKRVSRILSVDYSFGWCERVKQLLDLDQLRDIDIVIGTYPIMDSILAGKYIARKLGVPFVAEIRDLISDYEEAPEGFIRMKKPDRLLERLILCDVDGIVAVTQGFQDILKRRYPYIPATSVYNGWDDRQEEPVSTAAKSKYLYYAGTLYEHRLESLSILFQVAAEYGLNTEIRIRSHGPKSLDQKLDRMIEGYGLKGQVKRLPSAEGSVVQEELAGAYINLVPSSIHEEDKALMTTLPGKLFELMRCPAPVLAIVPEKSEIATVISSTGKGIATIDKRKIFEFLTTTAYSQYPGNESVNQYSRKNQTKRLCEFLDSILKIRGKAGVI